MCRIVRKEPQVRYLTNKEVLTEFVKAESEEEFSSGGAAEDSEDPRSHVTWLQLIILDSLVLKESSMCCFTEEPNI